MRTLPSRVSSSLSSTRPKVKTLPIYFKYSTIRMASSKRRFAPLGQAGTDGAPALKGIVFDMDGTLCTLLSSFTIRTDTVHVTKLD